MSITSPSQLVEEFKKSGEFDRLRRELLKEFRQSEGVAAFLARVEDVAKQKLESDAKLEYMPEANVNREVMQELERYPIVVRAVSGVPQLNDPAFIGAMRETVRKILHEDRRAAGQSIDDTPANASTQVKPHNPGIVQRDDGNDSDGESSAESMDIEECSSD